MLKKLLAGIGLLGLLVLGAPQSPPAAYANSTDAAKKSSCEGIGGRIDSTGKCEVPGTASLSEIIANVVNLISLVVGIVAVIMIIVGGFKYVTASGDATKLTSAQTTILYAVIGIVIVALAQSIARLVINKTT